MNWDRFFGIGSEAHRQVYRAWREYPIAMQHTLIVGALAGSVGASIILWAIT